MRIGILGKDDRLRIGRRRGNRRLEDEEEGRGEGGKRRIGRERGRRGRIERKEEIGKKN